MVKYLNSCKTCFKHYGKYNFMFFSDFGINHNPGMFLTDFIFIKNR